MKLDYKVYEDAAETVADESVFCLGYCCLVLMHSSVGIGEFTRYFRPYGKIMHEEESGWFGTCGNKKNQMTRSLALLFMAEITKEMK